ncbi:stress response protein NST1 [Manduca sexta]|uniref:stress response protein NST1 n=1 Tax=Manduca sexta TaxID=7130 RepID=UPI0011839098|nr:stress response protein NST1 [Manduca sexta]
MHITYWGILASVLLFSVNAGRYDQGPQQFFEPSAPSQVVPNYETKDIVLYLTPSQVQALEAGGAELRPQEDDSEQLYPVKTDQEQEEESEQSNDKVEEENYADQKLKEISELEEIFRILNKQIEEDAKKIHGDSYSGQISGKENGQEQEEDIEEEQQAEEKQLGEQDEAHQEEKQIGNFRKIPSRFGVLQRYRLEKYFSPSVSKKQNQHQQDSSLPSLPYYKKSYRFQEQTDKKSDRDGIKENVNSLQDKYKVTPAEEESQEENKQKLQVDLGQEQLAELLNPISENNKILQFISEHRGQLVHNELQLYKKLQELKAAPKHHQRKYETEIERLRTNLQAQNALETAEALARATRFSPKEQFDENNFQLDNDNRENLPSGFRSFTFRRPQQFAPLEVSTPIPVPVIKSSRIEIKTPVLIKPVRLGHAAARNKAFLKVNNSYEQQAIPVIIDRQVADSSKHEESTITRHLWEH